MGQAPFAGVPHQNPYQCLKAYERTIEPCLRIGDARLTGTELTGLTSSVHLNTPLERPGTSCCCAFKNETGNSCVRLLLVHAAWHLQNRRRRSFAPSGKIPIRNPAAYASSPRGANRDDFATRPADLDQVPGRCTPRANVAIAVERDRITYEKGVCLSVW